MIIHEKRVALVCTFLSVASLALSGFGCARTARLATVEPGGDHGLAAYQPSEVHQPPRLIKCADAQGPQPTTIKGVRWDHVTLGFVVTEEGLVDPISIFVKRSEAKPAGGSALQRSILEAQDRALTCRYQPGAIEGQPVRVTMERTFRILAHP